MYILFPLWMIRRFKIGRLTVGLMHEWFLCNTWTSWTHSKGSVSATEITGFVNIGPSNCMLVDYRKSVQGFSFTICIIFDATESWLQIWSNIKDKYINSAWDKTKINFLKILHYFNQILIYGIQLCFINWIKISYHSVNINVLVRNPYCLNY
jgi:hypothetical protein